MIDKLIGNLFDLYREETVGEVVVYRIFELALVYWTVRYSWLWGHYLGRLEDVLLPLGFAEYLDISFMFDNALGFANAVAITIMMLAGYFRVWRYAYLVTLLLFHVQYVARYSQGEISHGSNFVGIAVLAMAASTLTFRQTKKIRRTALGLCYFFFGAGYTSAALSKLVGTGLHWPHGRHLRMWIQERTIDAFSLTGVAEYNWLQELALEDYAVATSILTFGLLVESFGFLMWFRRLRPAIMTLLVFMHIGIWAVMKLTFTANVYILLMLAYPWNHLIDRGLSPLEASKRDRIQRLSTRLA